MVDDAIDDSVNRSLRNPPKFCGFVAVFRWTMILDPTRKSPILMTERLSQIFAPARLTHLAFATLCVGALAACSGAPTAPSGGLAPGLVAQVTSPGAQMDRQAALGIINQYRATRGVAPLTADPALDVQAQQVAGQYANTSTPPSMPSGVAAMRLSAGYTNFAETFSGWRNSPADANVLAQGDATRAGFAAVYDANSAYGTHWVMLLGR